MEAKSSCVHIQWQGPFGYKDLKNLRNQHSDYGIYQIYGGHPIYGSSVLLYVGKAQLQTFGERLKQEQWNIWNIDSARIEIYVGRLSGAETPEPKEWNTQIDLAEKLLIFAHGPAANSSNLNKIPPECADLHIFNWGQFRDLMPEVSGARWSDHYWQPDEEESYAAYGTHDLAEGPGQ